MKCRRHRLGFFSPEHEGLIGAFAMQGAWTVLYPHCTVVVPRTVLSYPVGYALPQGSE